jgi:hypothetical protein
LKVLNGRRGEMYEVQLSEFDALCSLWLAQSKEIFKEHWLSLAMVILFPYERQSRCRYLIATKTNYPLKYYEILLITKALGRHPKKFITANIWKNVNKSNVP